MGTDFAHEMSAMRAVVVPRGRLGGMGEVLPVEYFVDEVLRSGKRAIVDIYGPAGSGKSVALRHLEGVFGGRLEVVHEKGAEHVGSMTVGRVAVIGTTERFAPASVFIEMAPWGRDEFIEYLLKAHKERCRSVMERIEGKGGELDGLPELWAGVLDEFAVDEGLVDVEVALRRMVLRQVQDPSDYELAARGCLEAFWSPHPYERSVYFSNRLPGPLLRHRVVGMLMAGEQLARYVEQKQWGALEHLAPLPVVERAARLLKVQAGGLDGLAAAMVESKALHPMGASLLVAAEIGWRPQGKGIMELGDALLRGVRWSGLNMGRWILQGADLHQADLSEADVSGCRAEGANFRQANLRHANLKCIAGKDASFVMADLSMAHGEGAVLAGANLNRARLIGAVLPGVNLCGADLRGSDCSGAMLERADFSEGTQVAGADFAQADLMEAVFEGVRLRDARFEGASFERGELVRCNLEGMNLPGANFQGADMRGSDLTGSVMPRANFRGASLRRTGLARVDWEGADLRDVDFRWSSFHLGSSRSGLVGSTIASEGSRTGFYTDDYEEKHFKHAEEIRKANLRGCDLRGAIVKKTDFYLVDLRDAIYDEKQGRHFARCGAILNVRV